MELMIDFETLGTNPDSVILSIGACFFDINKGIGQTFYQAVDIDNQIKDGRTISGDTLKWWMKQDKEAQKVFTDGNMMPIHSSLLSFAQFISKNNINKDVCPWGNGATFDISLAENLFKQYTIPCPWKYSNVTDFRTFKRFVAKGANMEASGVKHNALDDAIWQANYVIKYGKNK